MLKQSTNHILMIEPSSFMFNEETAVSNEFQNNVNHISQEKIAQQAIEEHQKMVQELQAAGIQVNVIKDTPSPIKPDAIFPNNWIMFHHSGKIITFPMKNYNRQLERRIDIVDYYKNHFQVQDVIDLSHFENEDLALEGTGSIVFNHQSKTAYACLSPRTEESVLKNLCEIIGYDYHIFKSYDSSNKLIYHTNVVMCVGSGYVVIGLNSILDQDEKKAILSRFQEEKLEVVELNDAQLNKHFAGNMLEVLDANGIPNLVMSKRAFNSLDEHQKAQIEKYAKMLPVSIDIIETVGGGSARCMMAEVFLTPKN
jgi:hypothetical protein